MLVPIPSREDLIKFRAENPQLGCWSAREALSHQWAMESIEKAETVQDLKPVLTFLLQGGKDVFESH